MAVCGGGGLPRGGVCPGGCLPGAGGGVCPGGFLPRGVSAWVVSQESVCPGGVSAWGVSHSGGVCLRGVVSEHALRQTPPVNRMTDRCKNITFPQLRLRTVILGFRRDRVWEILDSPPGDV